MQIAIRRHASARVRMASSPFASSGLDRSYSIVESLDISASRRNRSFVLSLMYHKNALAINKYVEAEQRTTFRVWHDGSPSFRFPTESSMKSPAQAGTSRLSATADGDPSRMQAGENWGLTFAADGAER